MDVISRYKFQAMQRKIFISQTRKNDNVLDRHGRKSRPAVERGAVFDQNPITRTRVAFFVQISQQKRSGPRRDSSNPPAPDAQKRKRDFTGPRRTFKFFERAILTLSSPCSPSHDGSCKYKQHFYVSFLLGTAQSSKIRSLMFLLSFERARNFKLTKICCSDQCEFFSIFSY